ncbi:ABC transporter ATP-binding protein [Paraclostridium sordellii]|uniref:ABC transporter ATP-binding protein n=1 Tax=Paraclostridium sordellii TaxID=1505 RepID=UPI000C77DB1A|nr:ABC transporter ATP-binding protein [Paeniclostridium sordellii]AUN13592.1 multidrug ABC transporter ATP-binding protein [Paeniclostridium sordellii]MDU5020744.1 ABC transporter ATP-binding protein [Clostridiales bacterium]
MSTVLKVKNIEKYYGNKKNLTKAINNISFEVDKGEFIGIMGPSGSGKTTLLNCIATIDKATTGNIQIEDKDITTLSRKNIEKFRREHLGFIFQEFNLLDTLNVYENISLALSILGVKGAEIDKRVKSVSSRLGIADILTKFPYEISGGQKQRVACARAIINEPALILADEPTGSLDSKSARVLLENLSDLNESMNSTIMMVTHDAFTASYCKRILFIKDGKIFNELIRGNDDRKEFFKRIIEVVTLLGGDNNNVI